MAEEIKSRFDFIRPETKIVNKALSGIKLKWSLPDLQVSKVKKKRFSSDPKKRQPEFASPARYFPKSHLNTLIKVGRKKQNKWKKVLNNIKSKYGVNDRLVLSIWGRETSFGRAKLPTMLSKCSQHRHLLDAGRTILQSVAKSNENPQRWSHKSKINEKLMGWCHGVYAVYAPGFRTICGRFQRR